MIAGGAQAQQATITGGLTPNTAGTGSRVHVEFGGSGPELAGPLSASRATGAA